MAYRVPIEAADASATRELVVAPSDRTTRNSALVLLQLLGVPGFVAYGANELIGGYAAWPAFVLAAIAMYTWWRGSKDRGRATFRLDGDELHVVMRDGIFRTRRLETKLDALRDVALDTKTIQRVQDGSALVPQAALISTTVGGAIDRSRIVLVTDDETTPLFEDDLAHMEATEWTGKIRVFLRRGGWTPLDERGGDDAA